MQSRVRRFLAIGFVFLGLGSASLACFGLRSVGVRVVLPLGGAPLMFGVEASTDLAFGIGSASFFLTSSGKALITLSGDVRLAEPGEGGEAFVRATAGLYYFDTTRFLPSLLIGCGIAYRLPVSSYLELSVAGEFLYPIAFPAPMVSLAGRWTL